MKYGEDEDGLLEGSYFRQDSRAYEQQYGASTITVGWRNQFSIEVWMMTNVISRNLVLLRLRHCAIGSEIE